MRDAFTPDVVPGFWEKLEEAVADGRIISIDMVRIEIGKQDDDLNKWAKARPSMFLPTDQQTMNEVSGLIKRFPKFATTKGDKDFADPFLVAHAVTKGLVVVTQENLSGDPGKKLKIPDVCDALNIPHLNMLKMVKELGWVFR